MVTPASVSTGGLTVNALSPAARRACMSDEPLSNEVHTKIALPAPSTPTCGSDGSIVEMSCGVSGAPPAGHLTTASSVDDDFHVANTSPRSSTAMVGALAPAPVM